MWIYEQATGRIFKDGVFVGEGYAGHGEGVNNPGKEDVPMVGPIPAGDYIIGPAFAHPKAGQVTMRLTPQGHSAKNRTGFLIHGDNTAGNKSASNGCIIQSKPVRQKIANDQDKLLRVVAVQNTTEFEA